MPCSRGFAASSGWIKKADDKRYVSASKRKANEAGLNARSSAFSGERGADTIGRPGAMPYAGDAATLRGNTVNRASLRTVRPCSGSL